VSVRNAEGGTEVSGGKLTGKWTRWVDVAMGNETRGRLSWHFGAKTGSRRSRTLKRREAHERMNSYSQDCEGRPRGKNRKDYLETVRSQRELVIQYATSLTAYNTLKRGESHERPLSLW